MSKEGLKIDFIGIGVERCGTSWLFECLREHPEVCASKYKEVDYFKHDEKYNQGLEYYSSFFSHCNKDKIIGEFSPRYYFSENVPQRIASDFPDVKLIVIFRNPIEKSYSLYKMKSSYKSLPHKSFEEFIEDYKYMRRSFYTEKTREWMSLFPRDNMLFLIYEDIEKDPREFVRKVYDFLGVDKEFVPRILNSVHNSPELRNPLKSFVFTILSKIKRSMLKLEIGKKIVYAFQKTGVYGRLEYFFAKGEKKVKKRDPIKEETRMRLREMLKSDIEEFSKLIDRNLNDWK